MALSYGKIIRGLAVTKLKLRSNNARNSKEAFADQEQGIVSRQEHRRIVVTCLGLVSCFLFLWLPFYAGHLAKLSGIALPEEKVRFLQGK